MEKRYSDLFIDFDDTLYDTHGNAQIALGEMFENFNLQRYFPSLESFTVPYWIVNAILWGQYARGEITRDYLMVERFRRPLTVGMGERATEEFSLQVSDHFLNLCADKPGVLPDAHRLMQHLRGRGYGLHLCSNGFHEVQYRKLRASHMMEYFDSIILSEDAGANKPSPQFFDYALQKSGARRESTLMIGDNYSTDIVGARQSGLSTMFFNAHPEQVWADGPVDFEVNSLAEIIDIL